MKLTEQNTLPGLLRELEIDRGGDPAVIFQQREEDLAITYSELIHKSAVFSKAIKKAGIRPGEPVIIILEHSPELIFSFFGAMLQGAIPAIMPFLTEKLSPQRYRQSISSLIEITRPAMIVTYRAFQSEIESIKLSGSSLRSVIYVEDQPASVDWDWSTLAGLDREATDIVLLQHSSGTTGLQKGVALSHRAVINQLQSYSQALELVEEDVIVSWLPLYHDMGLIAGFILPILMGNMLVLMSPFDWVRAPHRLMRSVSAYQGTLSWLPNFAYNFSATKIRDRDLEGVDLSSWRAVINCSEPMRYESHEKFLTRFEPYGLRRSALATCYAMAENVFAVTQGGISSPVTVDEVSRESLSSKAKAEPAQSGDTVVRMLSAGLPISNTEIKIVDREGSELPERSIGEIALRGSSLLSGYYRRPDLTETAFLGEWYKTGDLGYLYQGELFITGRAKELIIVGGKNIYPQDLEALVHEVPGVYPGRAVAFGVDNISLGTEDVVIVAEMDEGLEMDAAAVASRIRKSVAEGSDVTARYVRIVERGWLIKTSSGKNARTANKAKYLAELGS
ncbi:MAG: AMP-binding protein [Anaerolineales bacterium]|jgi:acyl-CoA synthetase (AMP-forming)/AMP-acid ligase II